MSLIIQAAIGCSHNRCTFCSMYKDKKFRIRDMEEILEDIEEGKKYYGSIKRVFLADGNALAMKTEDLKTILFKIRETMLECERVGIYGSPKDILRKRENELKELRELGLGIIYMGMESGSDDVLLRIKKGASAADMIEAGRKIVNSGIKLSITLISGIGGRELWEEHALESARVLNAINPHYLGLLTLLLEPGTELESQVRSGSFELLNPIEIVRETRLLLEKLEVRDCVFRSNHASNYFALAGTLPQDKERLLAEIDRAMGNNYDFRNEYFRRL